MAKEISRKGFQKGHKDYVPKESRISAGKKISKILGGKKKPNEVKEKIRNFYKTNPRSREFYKKIGLTGLINQQNNKKPTILERIVYKELERQGVSYFSQYLINNRFLVDAYIPDKNIAIECDGRYWHSLDKVQKKDKAENAYLKKCMVNLIRLPEEEIMSGKYLERMVF